MLPLRLLLASAALLHGAEPVGQAAEARVWLKVPAGQAPLRDLRVSAGSAAQAPWERDPEVRARHTDVLVPIRWWDWREFTIRFTPAADGEVELVLTGPWARDQAGAVLREEVLWDDISASGTEIANGGFEARDGDRAGGWKSLFGGETKADEWPLAKAVPREGKYLAASWQNRPLGQTLRVAADREVTLTLHARAATLPGFSEPKALGHDTPAHRAAARLKRGVNLGNCWEAPPPYSWGVRFAPEDIDRIAAEGFDHIRVPVAWTYHLKDGPGGLEIDPALLAELEPVLRRALERKLHVLLDWHHFDDLTTDPAANRARFVTAWETLARHFKTWPAELYLELLNEPRDAMTTEVASAIYADAIAAIRRIDPQRILVVSPGDWGNVRELDKLRLPDAEDRTIVTVHCYEPFYFTHQGAGWIGLRALRGVVYPGPPATPLALPEALKDNAGVRQFLQGYNTLPAAENPCSPGKIREALDLARDWSAHFGRPVDLGEFGSNAAGDRASRERYSRDVRTMAEERHIPWALWEWKAGFGYWDPRKNEAVLRGGLFE